MDLNSGDMSKIGDTLAQMSQARQASADLPTLGSAPYEYDAFISYRRRDAKGLARWIRDRLVRYKLAPEVLEVLPPEKQAVHERKPRVYLDKAYEKSSDDFLNKKLYPALDRSARLIVILTPSVFDMIRGEGDTEEPNWLVREIDRFFGSAKANTSPRPVDVVLGPGGSEDRFPGRLAERERWDWIDLRLFNWWRSLGLSEELDIGLTKLVAGLYDIPETQLPVLRREERRRRNRWLVGISILAIAVGLVIGLLGLFAWQQERKATRNSEIAEARRLTAEAELIITQQPARLGTGVLRAVDAVGRFRRLNLDSPEASEMVRRGLALLPRIKERQKFRAPAVTVSRNRAVFSSGGRYFAVSNNEKIIQLFDLRDGAQMRKLTHDAPVNYIRFSANERYLLTTTGVNNSANPVIWNLRQGEPRKVFEKKSMIRIVAISADGRYLMTSGSEEASVWETATGKTAYSFQYKAGIIASEFSPNGRYLALLVKHRNPFAQGSNNTYKLVLFSVGSWTKAKEITINQHADIIRFSPDANYISTASRANSTISVWNVTSGAVVSRMHHNTRNGVNNIKFSPTGTFLASGSYDMSARIWKTQEGSEVTRIKGNSLAYAIAFSPDEKYVVTAFVGDNVARIWNTETGAEVARMSHGDAVLSTTFLPDGMYLATASSDGYLRIWSMQGISVAEHELDRKLQAVYISPNGRFLATLSSADERNDRPPIARIWDSAAKKETFSIAIDESEHDQIGVGATNGRGIAVSNDGKYLTAVAYWSAGQVAQFWATEGGSEIYRVASPVAVNSVSLSSKGKYLATVSEGVGRLWDINRGQPIHPNEFPANIVDFSADEKYVVMIDGNKKKNTYLRVYLLETGNKVNSFRVTDDVRHIAFSYDGKLAATTDGRAIQVWDVTAGSVVRSFKQNERITSLAFDLTAEFLAASTEEGSAQIWRLRAGQKVYKVYHEGYLAAVAFSDSKNGKRLLTANGYVTRMQGESAPNETNSARLWHWEQADIIADACSRLSGLTKRELFQGIYSDESFAEICSNPASL